MSNDTPPGTPPRTPPVTRSGAHRATESTAQQVTPPATPPVATQVTPPATPRGETASVGEVVDYVKTYAKQETVGPLRGAGRWVAYGAAGAISLGVGLSLLLLGLLRLIQSETGLDTSTYWSWVPYLIVLVVCAAIVGLAALQINKTFLNKEDKP